MRVFTLNNAKSYVNFKNNISYRNELWISFEGFDKANFWDLFFYFVSKKNKAIDEWDWCDIESTMLEWLRSPNDNDCRNINKSFEFIYRTLSNDCYYHYKGETIYYLSAFIYKKNGEKGFADLNEFYTFFIT